MNFQVGDRAIVKWSQYPSFIGETVTILTPLVSHCTISGRRYQGMGGVHEVDLPSPDVVGTNYAFRPWALAPIPPDEDEYDGYEVTSWDVTIFKPR